MHTSIDGSKCQGHGRCVMTAPDVYDVDDMGNGMVLLAEVPADLAEDVAKAVASCPEQAISMS